MKAVISILCFFYLPYAFTQPLDDVSPSSEVLHKYLGGQRSFSSVSSLDSYASIDRISDSSIIISPVKKDFYDCSSESDFSIKDRNYLSDGYFSDTDSDVSFSKKIIKNEWDLPSVKTCAECYEIPNQNDVVELLCHHIYCKACMKDLGLIFGTVSPKCFEKPCFDYEIAQSGSEHKTIKGNDLQNNEGKKIKKKRLRRFFKKIFQCFFRHPVECP